MSKYQVLETVTEKFDLSNHFRSDGNTRRYIIDSVQAMINSPKVQERLKLRELYGYFGHNRRELADKNNLGEVEVIIKNGKPVVLENVPAAVTTAIEVDGSGIVTYTQDILSTPAGHAVKAMRDGGAGGWSWAIDGVRTLKGAVARMFHGFDYVKHPSYINPDKVQMMMESVKADTEEAMLEKMLEGVGFDAGQLGTIDSIWSRNSLAPGDVHELNAELMMMESLVAEKDGAIEKAQEAAKFRQTAMLEAVGSASVFLTDKQRDALVNLSTDEDKATVTALFESLAATRPNLPVGAYKAETVKRPVINDDLSDHAVMLSSDLLGNNWS